jgi:GH24 family phage-related lysozyme (muramidase)
MLNNREVPRANRYPGRERSLGWWNYKHHHSGIGLLARRDATPETTQKSLLPA